MSVDRDSQREGVESCSTTVRAGDLAHVALDLIPLHVRFGILVATTKVGHHTLEVGRIDTGPSEPVLVPDLHPPSDSTPHEGAAMLG